jgi:hypothetical protein
MVGDAADHVAQIGFGVEAVELGGLDDGVHQSRDLHPHPSSARPAQWHRPAGLASRRPAPYRRSPGLASSRTSSIAAGGSGPPTADRRGRKPNIARCRVVVGQDPHDGVDHISFTAEGVCNLSSFRALTYSVPNSRLLVSRKASNSDFAMSTKPTSSNTFSIVSKS